MARPAFRLTAKNKETRQVTELLACWPPREGGPDGVYGVTLSKDLDPKDLAKILASSGKDGDYFLDLRRNDPPKQRDGEEW